MKDVHRRPGSAGKLGTNEGNIKNAKRWQQNIDAGLRKQEARVILASWWCNV
jgi:hypothetical protein